MVRPALIETSVSARTDRKYKYIYLFDHNWLDWWLK